MRIIYRSLAAWTAGICAVLSPLPALAETVQLGYTSSLSVATTIGGVQGNVVGGAVRIPAERAVLYKGSSITGLNIGFGSGSNKNMTMFVSEDLSKAPALTQQTSAKRVKHWAEYEFDTPYVITGDRDIYVGYYVDMISTRDYPVGADNIALSSDDSNLISTAATAEQMWGNFHPAGAQYGNLCLRAMVTGDVLPEDAAFLMGVNLPLYVAPGGKFDMYTTLLNWGTGPVRDAVVEYTLDGDTPVSFSFTPESQVDPGMTAVVTVTGCSTERDNAEMPVTLSLASVNGKPVPASGVVEGNLVCTNSVFERRVVVEEGTGTWCPNCPIGYVGLEYMRDKFTDGSYIGIAVHNNDPMAIGDYAGWERRYISGYPKCSVNREAAYTDIMPGFSTLEGVYGKLHSFSFEKVTVAGELSEDHKVLKAKAVSEFLKDYPSSRYAVAFVLTEDNVGPYSQKNKFAGYPGSTSGLAEEFEKMEANVSLHFNDVLRHAAAWDGETGSVPTDVKAGEKYPFEEEIRLESDWNVENLNLIALLIDKKTGVIANADATRLVTTSVESIGESGNDSEEVKYYTLQGIRVDRPGRGIYVRRQGSDVRKVVVK